MERVMKRVKLTWKNGDVDYFNCLEEISGTPWYYDATEGIDYIVEEIDD